MPTYTVLGATGSTGSRITRQLLERKEVHVNLYARSASKLANLIPDVTTASNATIFTSPLSDQATITAALDGVSIVFGTLAQNYNQAGLHIAQDQARAIVTGLETLRTAARKESKEWHAPRIVLLSAATLTADGPRKATLGDRFLYHSNFYIYEDLRLASEYIHAEAPWLDPPTLATPAALVESQAEGFELGPEHSSITLSYDDLADAMIAMGESAQWKGHHVNIASKGKMQYGLLLKSLVLYVLPGSVVTSFPSTFRFFKSLGFLS